MMTRCSIATALSPGSGILPDAQRRVTDRVDGRRRGTSRRPCARPAGTSRSSSSRATRGRWRGRCCSSRRCRWRSRSPSRRRWSAPAPRPVVMSRTQRFQSRMNTARLPSGDVASGLPSDEVWPAPPASAAAASRAPPPNPTGGALAHGCRLARRLALLPIDATRPPAVVEVEQDVRPVRRVVDRLERELARLIRRARGCRQRRCQLDVIEGRLARARDRVDEDELGAVRRGVAIPEPFVGQPVRGDAAADDERRQVRRQELLGPRVVGGRQAGRRVRAAVLRGDRGEVAAARRTGRRRRRRGRPARDMWTLLGNVRRWGRDARLPRPRRPARASTGRPIPAGSWRREAPPRSARGPPASPGPRSPARTPASRPGSRRPQPPCDR